MNSHPVIEAVQVEKQFRQRRFFWGGGRLLRAVDGVDLAIYPGEIFGLVGESGCGKTTLGRLLVGLIPPTRGTVRLEDRNIHDQTQVPRSRLRRSVQIVFQDPYGSLNPSFRIATSLWEAFRLQGKGLSGPALRREMERMMDEVGLSRAVLERHPHQLSGGQRQRVGIARALATGARFLVLDEPVSALDVSVQSQILNLLLELRQRLGLTYVLISHDLGVVRYLCDRVAVMYLGRIVESGDAAEVLERPRHPYTEGLLGALPKAGDRGTRSRPLLVGDLPSPLNVPAGCRFHPRCRYGQPQCRQGEPALSGGDTDGWQVACFSPVGARGQSDASPWRADGRCVANHH